MASHERRAQARTSPWGGPRGGEERGVRPQGCAPADRADRERHGPLDADLAAGREGDAALRCHREGLPRRHLGLAGRRGDGDERWGTYKQMQSLGG